MIIQCKANNPSVTYKWIVNDGEISDHTDKVTFDPVSGNLTISKTFNSDIDGDYQCIAISQYGKAMTPYLTLKATRADTFTGSVSTAETNIIETDYLKLKCENVPESVPPWIFSWEILTFNKNGEVQETQAVVENERLAIDKNGALHILWLEQGDENIYACSVFNTVMLLKIRNTEHIKLTVTPKAKDVERDPLLKYNPDVTVYVGTTAVLTCIFTYYSSDKQLSIVWYHRGEIVGHDRSITIPTMRDPTDPGALLRKEGDYLCEAALGNARTSGLVLLTIVEPPQFLPYKSLASIYAPVEKNAVFRCEAESRHSYAGPPVWLLNTDPIIGCPPRFFECKQGLSSGFSHCIPESDICDGYPNCGDYSDEENCEGSGVCPETQKLCGSKCVSGNENCEDVICGDYIDEENCEGSGFCPETQKLCGSKCVPGNENCEEVICGDYIDEENCEGSANGAEIVRRNLRFNSQRTQLTVHNLTLNDTMCLQCLITNKFGTSFSDGCLTVIGLNTSEPFTDGTQSVQPTSPFNRDETQLLILNSTTTESLSSSFQPTLPFYRSETQSSRTSNGYTSSWSSVQPTYPFMNSTAYVSSSSRIEPIQPSFTNGTQPTNNMTECRELQPRSYVKIIYDSGTDNDSVVIFTCPLGMRSNGSKTPRCQINGTWSHPVPICVNISCSDPEIPQNGFISLLSNHTYLFNQTIINGCDSGYTLQGFTSRICQANGQWSGYVPNCSMVQPRECSGDIDDRGTVWNKTTAGQISSKHCTPGYHGTITRVCTVDGRWLLPLYNCVRKTIEEIGQVVARILEAPTEKLVDEVLSYLTQETGVSNTVSLQDGEIILITEIMGNIATASRNVTINQKQQENFIEIASNLVDKRTFNSWAAIAQDDTGNDTRVDGVMRAVEEYADAIVSSSQPFNDIEIKQSNIVFSISNARNKTIEDLNFPLPALRKELNTTSFYVLPRQALKDVKYSSSVYYKTLDQILPAYNKERTISDPTSINSAVLALKLIPYPSELNSPLTLTFEHLTDELDNPTCSYWDFTINGWRSDGCNVKQTTKNMTQCECTHLTNFAILMSPYRQVVSQTLSIITLVGSTLSLVLLGVTLVMHVFLWRYVKSDRVFMLMNLVVALTISYLLFIFGVEETGNKTVCTTIAVALHYFLLLVFFMMLCVTVEIAISVIFVFGSKQRRSVILLPVGWGVPVVIVTTSALRSNLDGYGTSDYCWLSIEDGLIWAFVGPAIVVISINLIMLVVILKRMFSTRFMVQKSGMEKIRATIRSLCVLIPVMGITWIFGVFYINEDTQWIQYLFAVCNSLQGVVIFIFHCALNKQIHTAVRQTRRRLSVATSSDSKISKPRPIETHSV